MKNLIIALALMAGCASEPPLPLPTLYMTPFEDNGEQICCMDNVWVLSGCNRGCIERDYECLCSDLCECRH